MPATASRTIAIASRRSASLIPGRRRAWISAAFWPGNRYAKRGFGVSAPRLGSNTSRSTKSGLLSAGALLNP